MKAMIDRVREALGRQGTNAAEPRLATLPPPRLEGILPPIAPEEQVSKFELEFKNVSGSPHRASTGQEFEKILEEILKSLQPASVVLTRNPLLRAVRLAERLRARGVAVHEWPAAGHTSSAAGGDAGAYREQCFSAGMGITGVDLALAETGSLILSSETEGSQLASLAPPVHLAIYRRGQVVSSLDDALEKMSSFAGASGGESSGVERGRSIVFVTGTSRTADIEQILIRGVHGPRDVHAILLEETCIAELTTGPA